MNASVVAWLRRPRAKLRTSLVLRSMATKQYASPMLSSSASIGSLWASFFPTKAQISSHCYIFHRDVHDQAAHEFFALLAGDNQQLQEDRKSTRLNSSHLGISYAVFCL